MKAGKRQQRGSLRNPSRSVPKNPGGLGRGKIDFGKNKCIQRKRGKKHNKQMKNKAQNFLQSTKTQV